MGRETDRFHNAGEDVLASQEPGNEASAASVEQHVSHHPWHREGKSSVFISLTHLRHRENVKWALALFALVIAAALLAASSQGQETSAELPVQEGDSFRKGLSYVAWWSGRYGTPGADLSGTSGLDGCQLDCTIVTGHRETHTSPAIEFKRVSVATDANLICLIDHSRFHRALCTSGSHPRCRSVLCGH
jgi:hypothetical protein